MLLHPLLWSDKVAWWCTTGAFIIGPVPLHLTFASHPAAGNESQFYSSTFKRIVKTHSSLRQKTNKCALIILETFLTKGTLQRHQTWITDLLPWLHATADFILQIINSKCEGIEWKQDLTLTNTESICIHSGAVSLWVLFECWWCSMCICSSSGGEPWGKWFYFTFGMTAAAP